MANKLTPVDVYQIVNAAAQQMYGKDTALVATDTTSFVTVGEAMLRTGYENTLNALSYTMGRLYIAVRPYRHRFDLINMDDTLYGTISRKISYFTKLFEASGNWNTDLNSEQLKDGQSIDHYKINKSYPLEVQFQGIKTLEKSLTRWEEQLDVAFRSEEEMARFLQGMMTEASNEIEMGIEAENALSIQNFITGIYETGNAAQKVNLTKAFNTEHGTAYTTAQLLGEHLKEFIPFLTYTIKKYSDNLEANTSMYHLTPVKNDDEGDPMTLLRHTEKKLQKLFLLKDVIRKSEAMVFPEIFHDGYLKMENYEGVLYWQNPNDPTAIKCKPNILDVATGQSKDGTEQEIKTVIGMLFDRDAIFNSYKLTKVRTTPVNARGDYYNIFWHWAKSHNVDYTENAVIFYMEDEAA